VSRERSLTTAIKEFGRQADLPVAILAKNRTLRKERPISSLKGQRRSNLKLRRGEAKLAITDEAFPEPALWQLIDQCIAPALVDVFLRDQLSLPDPRGRAHNVDQP